MTELKRQRDGDHEERERSHRGEHHRPELVAHTGARLQKMKPQRDEREHETADGAGDVVEQRPEGRGGELPRTPCAHGAHAFTGETGGGDDLIDGLRLDAKPYQAMQRGHRHAGRPQQRAPRDRRELVPDEEEGQTEQRHRSCVRDFTRCIGQLFPKQHEAADDEHQGREPPGHATHVPSGSRALVDCWTVPSWSN